MFFPTTTILTLAYLSTKVVSHGVITSPYPRAVGPASLANCGSAVTAIIVADNTSHIEGLPQAAATDPNYNAEACNLWLCKGLQFADVSSVQTYTAGQVVPIDIFIRVPHAGTANVSVVDTASNEILGSELIYWNDYADQSLPTLPANNSAFSVTIPQGLEERCAVGGACVSFSTSRCRGDRC